MGSSRSKPSQVEPYHLNTTPHTHIKTKTQTQAAADARERARAFEQALAAGALGGAELLAALKPRCVCGICLDVCPAPSNTQLTQPQPQPPSTNKQPPRGPAGHRAPARLPNHPPEARPPPPTPPPARGGVPVRGPPPPAAGAPGPAAAERGGEQPGADDVHHEPRLPGGAQGTVHVWLVCGLWVYGYMCCR